MKILMTGGSGLLGTELQKHIKVIAPSHPEFDFTKEIRTLPAVDLIIHAGAYTDVVKAEKDKILCYKANVLGTYHLLKAYPGVPFVYISSEYAHKPVNHYSLTKLLAEAVVKELADQFLIIRTLFKPNPFPWDKAFIDQYTMGDYVNVIAPLIALEIKNWNLENKTVYLNTGRKTMFDLARMTRPDVQPCSVEDIKEVVLPKDYE